MAYFDELLQKAITVRNNRAPASNTADLVGGVLVGIVTALQMLLDDKQDELTFDTTPTADSQNPVTSDGIYQALQAIDLSACEKIVNKVTSINAQSTDVQYPTAKLLYDSLQALSGIYAAIQHTHAIADIINLQTELDARQLVSNLVTAITAQSTDLQYPSAKLLYDQLQGLAAVYAPKVHTHPFADIERPANVANVNAQGYTITTAYYSHVLTITADATLHLPTMQSGAAIILRLTIIQDATGGRAVTFDGGAALVFNPYQTDLSLGQANYRCWVVLWFDGVNWAWLASPYVLRAESQFAYTIDGTTGGQYVTVTINGTTMQIQATSGVWQYGYNNPINSIAFTGDTGVLNVDFTNSDGLANITTLADAFKNCAALVAVDFTGCDLSNVATAADCFAGCTSLAALTIPTGTWKPDIDLSACAAFTKAAMLAVIDGLYTYASGTHTVTFNSTAWDALSRADQQAVFDAADAKGWTTTAVAVTYVIRGTSSNVGQQISFAIQFIDDGAVSPSLFENIYCDVDNNGNWEYEYTRKKIYSLERFLYNCTNILTCDFSAADDFGELTSLGSASYGFAANSQGLTAVNFGTNKNDSKLTSINRMFRGTKTLQSVDLSMFTFANVNDAQAVFYVNTNIKSVDLSNATFANTTLANNFFGGATAMTSISMNAATFTNLQECWLMFNGCSNVVTISLQSATFAKLVNARGMFSDCVKLETINWSNNLNLNKLEIVSDTTSGQPAMFKNCKKITNATIAAFASGQTFAALKQSREWFSGCTTLTAINFADAIFDNVTVNSARWFEGCTALQSVSIANATFENAQVAAFMFNGCTALQSVDLRSAKFKSTTAFRNMFLNCTSLVTIRMDNCSGEASYENDNMFQNCNSLVNLSVGQNSTMPSLSASTSYGNIYLAAAPLTYTSILGVANWVRDYTGGTAHTITFNTTAWNALTAAEQATIQGILQAKNWNLATA